MNLYLLALSAALISTHTFAATAPLKLEGTFSSACFIGGIGKVAKLYFTFDGTSLTKEAHEYLTLEDCMKVNAVPSFKQTDHNTYSIGSAVLTSKAGSLSDSSDEDEPTSGKDAEGTAYTITFSDVDEDQVSRCFYLEKIASNNKIALYFGKLQGPGNRSANDSSDEDYPNWCKIERRFVLIKSVF